MRKLLVIILVSIIALLHIALLLKLHSSDNGEQSPLPEVVESPQESMAQPSAEVAAPSVPAGGQTAKPSQPQPAVAVKPSVGTSTSRSAMLGIYRPGFFGNAPKDVPAKLKTALSPVRAGLVIDLDQNQILWQKAAGEVHPIASLTKLLTSVMLMEHLESHPGDSLDTRVAVTPADRAYFKRHAINGVYLDAGESYSLDEYLMCMMIASANDCAYIVGEYLAGGNADAFPRMMNARAKALGLTDMHFNNANGLPVQQNGERSENTGSALDIAYLAVRAMQYPAIMKWAATPYVRLRADKKNPFDVNSTNKLLRGKVPGVTGLKTGFTDGAGYCIVVTCRRDGKNRMVVLMGVQGSDRGKRRDEIARQLLDWSYQP